MTGKDDINRNSISMIDLVKGKILNENKKDEKVFEIESDLCVYAASIVKNCLKQNKTNEQILIEMRLICNLFPTNYKEKVYFDYYNYLMEIRIHKKNLYFFSVLLLWIVMVCIFWNLLHQILNQKKLAQNLNFIIHRMHKS